METNSNQPAGYTYMGVAEPATNPGELSSTDKVYYETYTKGAYPFLGGITVDTNEFCYLMFDGSVWMKKKIVNTSYNNSVPHARVIRGYIRLERDQEENLYLQVSDKTCASTVGSNPDVLEIKEGKYLVDKKRTGKYAILACLSIRSGNVEFIYPDFDDDSDLPVLNPFRDDTVVFARIQMDWSQSRLYPVIDSPCIESVGYAGHSDVHNGFYVSSKKGTLLDLRMICPSVEEQMDRDWNEQRIIEGFIGQADTKTIPVEKPGSHTYYLTYLENPGTYTYVGFKGQDGNSIVIQSAAKHEQYGLYNNGSFWRAVKLRGFSGFQLRHSGYYSGVCIPSGTYLVEYCDESLRNLESFSFVGESRQTSRIINLSQRNYFVSTNIKNLTLYDLRLWAGGDYKYQVENVHFKTASIDTTYGLHQLTFAGGTTGIVRNCIFDYKSVAFYIYSDDSDYLEVSNCEFRGSGQHAIHIARIRKGAVVHNNSFDGSWIVAIFSGGNRERPMENIRIENNTIKGATEEGISFDGYGNNPDLNSNIGSGTLARCLNDHTTGLLKVAAKLQKNITHPDITLVDVKITDQDNWTNFYFTFNEGTGHDGLICKILGTEILKNKEGVVVEENFILDTMISADTFNLDGTGKCGVQSGFFNCVVRNNTLYNNGLKGNGVDYPRAIMLNQNCFNMVVENNVIYGFANGICVWGGKMLTIHDSLTFHNILRGNKIFGCANEALFVGSAYSPTGPSQVLQVGNIIDNNIIDGGGVVIEFQKNLILSDNQFNNSELRMASMYMDPPAKTDIGRIVMAYKHEPETVGDKTILKVIEIKPQLVKQVGDSVILVDL